jgi:asparagine synthetase B (glutamine-hydrolysing)
MSVHATVLEPPRGSLLDQPSAQDRLVVRYRPSDQELRVAARGRLTEPTESARGALHAIFDGYLHDRRELASLLGQSPTTAEAELVSAAYERWGDRLVEHLKGNYALFVADRARGSLLAIRDRTGVYPLFYAEERGELVLSTSAQALAALPGVSGEINVGAIAEYLGNRWSRNEETYYAAIRRVPPGHFLRVEGSSRRAERYFELHREGEPIDWIDEDARERFEPVFQRAVDRTLELGRPGICLSGGLDSISVTAAAYDRCVLDGRDLPIALSVDFPNPNREEEVAVQLAVARDLGLEQIMFTLEDALGDDSLLEAAVGVSAAWPNPLIGFFSPVYERLMLDGKDRGAQVILTGGGGDDLLGVTTRLAGDLVGQGRFVDLYRLWHSYWRSYSIPPHRMLRRIVWSFGAKKVLAWMEEGALRKVAPAALRAQRRWLLDRKLPEWLAPDPRVRAALDERLQPALDAARPKPGEIYASQGRSMLDHVIVSLELEEQFERSERLGIPIRAPYWDADLMQLLARIHPRALMRNGRSKALVREPLARRFPVLALERQKKITTGNFWPKRLPEARTAWTGLGGARTLDELGIVDGRVLDAAVTKILQNPDDLFGAFRIWTVLKVEAWVRPRVANNVGGEVSR